MENEAQLTLSDRLRGITVFLPAFLQKESSEVIGQTLNDFVSAAYHYGWVRGDVNWSEWKRTTEAEMLRDDPLALAEATEHQLACILTTCIRQDRFFEGTIEAAYEAGLFTRILQRAAAMLNELEIA